MKLIDKYESRFIILLFLMGLIISRPFTIDFLNSLTLWQGLLLWYISFGAFLHLVLRGLSISIGKSSVKKWSLRQTFATLLVIFATMIVWNWSSSGWANFGEGGIPHVLMESEDGVLFEFYFNIFRNAQLAADMTYIVTPMIFVVIAAIILAPGQMKRIFTGGKLR